MNLVKSILLVTSILTQGFFVSAASDFESGLLAMNQAKYTQAVRSFESVTKTEPSNVSAYFNLGKCYFETKQYGKAIWAFERVLKFNPRDGETPIYIEMCYDKLDSKLRWEPHTNGIQRLIFGVGSSTWTYISIVLSYFLAAFIFLMLKKRNNPWKRTFVFLSILTLILFAGSLIAAKSSAQFLSNDNFAIVTQQKIPTYMNLNGQKSSLNLTEGTKVEILNVEKKHGRSHEL